MKCCLCGGEIEKKQHPITGEVYWTQGNNAEPLATGRCCDVCNDTKVVPARMKMVERKNDNTKKVEAKPTCPDFKDECYTKIGVGVCAKDHNAFGKDRKFNCVSIDYSEEDEDEE